MAKVTTAQGIEFDYAEWQSKPLLADRGQRVRRFVNPVAPVWVRWPISDHHDRISSIAEEVTVILRDSLNEPERCGAFEEVWKSYTGKAPSALYWEIWLYGNSDEEECVANCRGSRIGTSPNSREQESG